MVCNIFINQQASLLVSDNVAPEAKVEDPEMQRRSKKSHETFMKKLREKLLEDNQKTQMTLKEFIDCSHQDLNDPASTLIAMEEGMYIMKEERNTEINMSIGMI